MWPSNEGKHMKPRDLLIDNWVFRAWLRAWLRYRLDAYTRSLHAIAAQRENDFHAERILHRAITTTRSKLQSL
jgi:hypothetical protein